MRILTPARLRAFQLIVVTVLLSAFAQKSYAVAKTATVTANIAWSSIVWSPTGAPAAGDDVTITCNGTFSITAIPTSIPTTGNFASFTVAGTGTLTLTGATSTVFTNKLVCNANTTLSSLSFNQGAMTSNASSVAAAKTLTIPASCFVGVTTGGVLTVSGTVAINANATGLLTSAASQVVVASGGSVVYTLTGQACQPATMTVQSGGTLKVTATSASTISQFPSTAISMAGTLEIGGSITTVGGSNAISYTGTPTLKYTNTGAFTTTANEWPASGPTTVILNSTSGQNVTLGGNVTRSVTTLTMTSGNLIVAASNPLSVTGASTWSTNAITVTSSLTISGAISNNGTTVTVNSGTLNLTGANGTINFNNTTAQINLSSTGTFNITSTNATPLTRGTNGIITAAGGSCTLSFSPATAQNWTIPSGLLSATFALATLTLDMGSSGSLTLNNTNDFTVATNFNLTSGKTIINTGSIQLAAGCNFNGTPGVNNMIVTSSTGLFKRTIASNGIGYNFPIGENTGTAEYSGFALTFSAGAASQVVGFRVVDGNPNSLSTSNYISRYWVTSFTGTATYTYSMSLPYNGTTGDVNGSESVMFSAYRTSSGAWNSVGTVNSGSDLVVYSGATQATAPLATNNEFAGLEVFCATPSNPTTLAVSSISNSSAPVTMSGTTGFSTTTNVDGIVVFANTTNTSAAPVDGVTYNVGDVLPSGAIVIYTGGTPATSMPWSYDASLTGGTDLSPNTFYYLSTYAYKSAASTCNLKYSASAVSSSVMPSVTLTNPSATTSCNNTAQTFSLTYSNVTGGADQYALIWNSAAITAGMANNPTNAACGVNSFVTLTGSPLTITIPAGVPAGTYTGYINPRNSSNGFDNCTYNGTGLTGLPSFTVTVNAGTAAPTGAAVQGICPGATVSNLVATGTNIQWYAAATGGSPLAGSTALVSGNHYYASQTVSGCESLTRLDVTVVTPVSGTVLVGTGQTYTTLTGAGGLFAAINANGLGSNVIAKVTSDLTETGANALNQWTEYCGSNYTLTIVPNDATVKTISGAVATTLIDFNGADRVTIDGRFNGTGTTKYLTVRNTNTSAAVFRFINDASSNTLQHLQIEGENTTTTTGLLLFSTTTATTGNDDNIVEYCNITDRTDAGNTASTPCNAIYSLGTASKGNSSNIIRYNNISNFFASASQSTGVRLEANNQSWTVDNNRVFQTVTRTPTSGEMYLVYLNSAALAGHNVTNNVLGYAASNGTGTLTFNGSGAARFIGIRVSTTGGTQNQITGNTIAGIAMTSTSGATSANGVLSGIYIESTGSSNVDDNTIGATTGNDAITVQSSTAGAMSFGISNAGTGTVIINNNKIGGITTTGSAVTITHGFAAIYNSSGIGVIDITNNLIGSSSTTRSIRANTANTVTATGTAQIVYGIYSTGSAGGVVDITGNQIRNLYNNATTTSTSTQLRGISVNSAALYTVDNNIIYNLETEAVNTGVGSSATLVGIIHNGGGTSQSISGNTIYGLQINGTSVQSNMYGIVWNASSSLTNSIERNFIHSFNSANTVAASEQAGIYIVGNFGATVANNMIRLGIKTDGNPVNTSNTITGIYDNSTAACNYYFNTVLINGASSASGVAANTYAFRRAAASGTKILLNNIFANNRTGGAGGSLHLAFATNTVTGYTGANFNYNIYHSADGTCFSTTASPASISGATPALKLQNLRTLVSGSNLNSGIATLSQINFVSATGDAATVNLKLNSPTSASDAGVNGTGETTDREGDSRSTTPDIGADEGPFSAIVAATDIYTPVITLSAIPTISTACGTSQTIPVTATITDIGTGLASGSLAPALWWRLSAGTWASVSASTVSGNTYTFNLNITGLAGGQSYQYYVAAQDQATTPNIGYSHFDATTPVHTDVVSQVTAPTTPGTFTISSTVPLSGTVNVGTGQTYTSLNANASTGLFYALMNNGLSGNLTVNITSDLNEAGLYYVLGNIPEYCGSGYTVTIVPSSASVKTIYQASGGNPLINLQGCTRIVFDGQYNNAGRYLTFASRQNTPTFYFNGNTNNITIKNCTIEGNNQLLNSVGPGVINFAGLLGTGSAISNITIDNNIIRDRSDITGTASIAPNSLIHAGPSSSTDATSTPVKSNITISNNEMFNFRESAIQIRQNSLGNGIGDNITITGNKIYEPINFSTYQYPVWLEGGTNSKGHTISNNLIGGNASPSPDITGTWTNPKADGEIFAIYALNGGTTPANGINISNNKISNITLSGGGWTNFLGIRVEEGTATVQNNLIGSLASSLSTPNITCSGSGSIGVTQNSAVMGIWTQSTGEVLIDGNTVCGVQGTSSNGYIFFDGITHGSNLYLNDVLYNTPGGKATITNNQVIYSRCASSLSNLAIPSPEGFMGIFCWTNASNNVIRGNKVNNCGSGTTVFGSNVRIHGMFVGVYGATQAQTGVVENNTVSYLFNENTGDPSTATSRNPIIYGLTIASGNWTVSNNGIYLNNGTQGGSLITSTNTSIRALNDGMLYNQSNCQAAYYHNTVVVAGSNLTGAGTANSTYAFLRFPLDYGSIAITAGAPITLRNNIFINNRGGSGNHRAIGNIANSNSNAAINWSSTTSDNNLYATTSSSMVSLWGASTSYDLASFKTSSGGDANSVTATTTSGTSSSSAINPSELFVNLASGSAVNLRINTTPTNAPYPYDFVSDKGASTTVATDVDGDARTSTPDIGLDEFYICVTPVVSGNTPTNPTCTGNDGSIALTGLVANTTYAVTYNKNSTPQATANYTTNGSGVLTISGLSNGTYNNFVLTIGPGCASAAYPASGSITLTNPVCGPNTWQGDVVTAPTDWFNGGNWSTGTAPTTCSDDVIIPTSPSGGNYFPVISGASAQVGNITVQAGASINIDNARTLSVCGNWTGSSTSTAATVTGAGKVVLTGSTAQAISGRTTFTTLHVTKTGGSTATVQSGSTVDVTTALELESGNLTNSGALTLKSTSTTHAIFNDFGAPVGTYTGTYTGSINAERYYRATSANSYNQHYMGSPVANATLAQFGAGGSSGAVTPTPDCSETQLASTSVYGSVFSYSEAGGSSCPMASWTVKANSAAATPAQGYSVAKTGAGVLTVSGTPNTATSYAVAGLTNSNWTKGTLQHPSTTAFGSGWHMVSNPYNATLDLTSITPPAGFDNQIQVWDVIQGQYYTLTGTKLIAPFQAFFVHKTSPGGSATYTIDGNWRTATPATFYAQSIPEQLTITATNTGNQLYDVATVGFNSDATDQFDPQFDANKLTGSIGRHNLSTQNNGYELNTNILHSITETSTVNLTFEPGSAGTYTLTFDGLNSFDPTSYIMLEDKQLNTMHDVRSGDYTFSATAQDNWNRFVLHFTPKAEIATTDQQCETLGTINVTQPGTANWNYTITDANNTTVSTGTLNETTPIATSVTTGTYTLTLTDNNNYQVVKTVTVNGTTPIVAAFSPSTTTTTTNTDVAFNSTTTATDYYWDFGDGTTATGQNAIHSYGDTGTYTVSLIVISANGCSNTTTQTVTVNAEVQTGIGNLNNNQNITIWSNGNTVYVDFSRITRTDATIEIYNVLGQQLVNEKYGRSSIFTKAIGNIEAAYVIVKVKQGEATTTKKVLITNVR